MFSGPGVVVEETAVPQEKPGTLAPALIVKSVSSTARGIYRKARFEAFVPLFVGVSHPGVAVVGLAIEVAVGRGEAFKERVESLEPSIRPRTTKAGDELPL